MTGNQIGALLMMGSMAGFTFNDALVKTVGGAMPLSQILTLRGLVATVLIYALARRLGTLRWNLPRRDWAMIAARCLAELCATYLFLTALMVTPLANLTAILQSLPLTITLGAAVFLGEPVGWRRMAAILVGFCGIVLIVRPDVDGFGEGTLYALAAVLAITARDLLTRRMSSEVPSMVVTLMASLSVLLFAVLASTQVTWEPVSGSSLAAITGAALFIFVGYLCSVMTMRVGDVAFISPFRYTGLLWALLLGWLVFDEWPDALTLLGAAIVVATGMFTLYRERKVSGG
ncbi:DMT family transporter [Parasedimentitalea psychrophila]|uniref:DMT family transporter n=1 Tax=Parasedimentitalea psychrophila TaxID=2997337 RepID=A0A9Y2L3Y6_9RHOB|nr:DMT family transporter [Parasedimentitalea psychrophila]WIY27246.1 DMT family transporter [Parasedimentitalea psychrophila]